MVKISEADHEKVSAAIAAAESRTNGEIVAVTTYTSDSYHDVGLHYAVLAMVAVMAVFAAFPQWLAGLVDRFDGWSTEPSLRELFTVQFFLAVLAFVIIVFALRHLPLRLALTPGATRTRRVRRKAIAIFKAAAERRTEGRTGILIYVSLGEHRAEIIGDEAITSVTTPETWGEAMADLIAELKQGRLTEGLVAAIGDIGVVLAEHFPRTECDTNEIPDKLIEL